MPSARVYCGAMDAANAGGLEAGAAALSVELGPEQVARFGRYFALLERWNSRINLTRILKPEEVVAKHFLDSLAIVPHLGAAQTLVDVGSGAGFPGVAVAIVRPAIRVTVVESVQKKAAFLEALRRELGISLDVRGLRLEQLGEAQFDVAVSRATFAPPEWVTRGASLVAPGGLLIAMLGRERPELPQPEGFEAPKVVPYALTMEGERALAVLRRRLALKDVAGAGGVSRETAP
jgi:16S rRNA (guanine527-N7)-methyltransferase